MRIIGVTGPSGSGKTILAEFFSRLGIPTINADEVYHSMLTPPSECLDAIRAVFGGDVFFDDGSLNRVALSKIVFCDGQKLELLNKTVLGLVLKEIRKQIHLLSVAGATAVIVDAPTLIESGFNRECHDVIAVLSPKSDRIKRISKRDRIDTAKAEQRVNAQKDDSFYIDAADYVIENNSDKEGFESKLYDLAASLGINITGEDL